MLMHQNPVKWDENPFLEKPCAYLDNLYTISMVNALNILKSLMNSTLRYYAEMLALKNVLWIGTYILKTKWQKLHINVQKN